MRIAYVAPGLGPSGGLRVIVEHVNRLADIGHDVVLFTPGVQKPDWIKIEVPILPISSMGSYDVVVATGFQTVAPAQRITAGKHFYFVQMMEHMFAQENSSFWHNARDSYAMAKKNGFEFITIANWLRDTLASEWGIEARIVKNGINESDFYPDGEKEPAILIEGDGRNQAKDIEGHSWRVALALREEFGVKLWGYAAAPNPYMNQLDHFVLGPTTQQMRQMYSRAQLLVKASRYEGRSLAPLEALSCGTTCARAIINGDDDLVNEWNCLRTPYAYEDLLAAGRCLMSDDSQREFLAKVGYAYTTSFLHWDGVIRKLEAIYAGQA